MRRRFERRTFVFRWKNISVFRYFCSEKLEKRVDFETLINRHILNFCWPLSTSLDIQVRSLSRRNFIMPHLHAYNYIKVIY